MQSNLAALQLGLGRLPLCLGLLLENSPKDLSRLRLGNLGDEPHTAAQSLWGRDTPADPFCNLLGKLVARLNACPRRNVGARDLGVLLVVPDAHDAAVGYLVVPVKNLVKLGGGHLEAL